MISLIQIEPWLVQYQYLILLPLTIIEGPIVTIIAGFLASIDQLNFWGAYGVVMLGDIIGDSLLYALGRYGQLERWGKYLRLTPERINQLKQHFILHTNKALVLGKLGHGVGGAILVAAGVARVPYSKFVRFNFLATLIKSFILMGIGFYFGWAYLAISKLLHYTALVMVGVSLALLIIYILVLRFSKKSFEVT